MNNETIVSEQFISELVERFYQQVREDQALGPIFARHIGDNWDQHLMRMKDFWSSVVLRAGRYSGRPVPKHQALQEVQPEHFERWLELFSETLAELAPSQEVIVIFEERAQRIATSLQAAMFGAKPITRRLDVIG
jgi:hemoglobin